MKRQRVKKCPLLLSVGAFLAVLFFLLHGAVYTASADTEGEFTYTVSNGETAITGYTGAGGEVVIPDTLGGYPVTSIGGGALSCCKNLTSVTIPDGVTSIGDGAFSCCEKLTSVTIPGGVTSIGHHTFFECFGLTSVTIPDSVTSIGDDAFGFCYNLTSVTIPDGVTSIGIGAFECCYNLTSVTIPDGVTSIGEFAFSYCKNLTCIAVSEENSAYTSTDGVLFNKDMTELVCYPAGKNGAYSIPNGVMTIGRGAFYRCSSLMSIIIPDSVMSIEDSAFSGCTGLTSVTFKGNAPSMGSDVFCSVNATAYYYPTNATWTAGTRLSYGGNLTWVPFKPTSITVATLPAKTEYERNEALDITGLTLTATYSDGRAETATSGYTVSGFASNTPGEKAVTVTYQDKTTTFSVTVKTPVLTGITVAALPTKTEYERNELLNTTGLTLTATYSDGSTETVTDGYTVSGFDSNTPGENTVTVKCQGMTTTFTVMVYGVTLISSTDEVCPGGTVTLTICVSGNNLLSINGTFSDAQGMTLTSVTSARSGWQIGVNGNNFTAYDTTMTNPAGNSAAIFYAVFEVNSDAEIGSTLLADVFGVTASDGNRTIALGDASWSGTVSTGWLTKYDGAVTYYIDEDGTYHTGWLALDGKRYYFGESDMVGLGMLWQNRWLKEEDTWYRFGDDGAALTGWHEWLEGWYYFTPDGAMVTGQQEIDGVTYMFDEYGVLQTEDTPAETMPLGERYVRIYRLAGDDSHLRVDFITLGSTPVDFGTCGYAEQVDCYVWLPAPYIYYFDAEGFITPEPQTPYWFDNGLRVTFEGITYYMDGGHGVGGSGSTRRGNILYIDDWGGAYEITENSLEKLNQDESDYDGNQRIYLYGDETTFMREDVSISVTGAKPQYTVGEELDVSALALVYDYTSGLKITQTEYLTADYDFSTPGEKTVTVNYFGNPEATFTVTVLPDESSCYTYAVLDGKATITGYTGAGGDVSIPDTLGGYPVASIGDGAFSCCENLTSVTIPGSVTSIGSKAFSGCSSLTSVLFKCFAPFIDEYAFDGVTATVYYYTRYSWSESTRQNYGGELTWTAADVQYIRFGEISDGTMRGYVISISTLETCASLAESSLNWEADWSNRVWEAFQQYLECEKDEIRLVDITWWSYHDEEHMLEMESVEDAYSVAVCEGKTYYGFPRRGTSIGAVYREGILYIVDPYTDGNSFLDEGLNAFQINENSIRKNGTEYVRFEEEKRYFLDQDSHVLHNRWLKQEDTWYLLGGDGIPLTGWQEWLEGQYYFTSDGAMVTGQQEIDGVTYVFDEYGVLQTEDAPAETVLLGERYVLIRSRDYDGKKQLRIETFMCQNDSIDDLIQAGYPCAPGVQKLLWDRTDYSEQEVFENGSTCLFQGSTYYYAGGMGDGLTYIRRGDRIYCISDISGDDMECRIYEITENGLTELTGDQQSTYMRDDVSISVTGAKPQYAVGEELDISALTLVYDYTSGLKITETESITADYDFSTPGEKTVTVRQWRTEATFTVTVLPPALTFYAASLTLQNNLKVNLLVDKIFFTEAGYTNPYVVFTLDGRETVVSNYTVGGKNGEYYVFSLADIAPDQMNDTITAVLHATYDGVEHTGDPLTYSIAQYCYSMLGKNDTAAKLRTLLVDLLRYGAAAQRYTGHNTAALADAMLTAEQAAWGTQSDPALTSVTNPSYAAISQPEVTWEAAGLRLGNGVTMQLYFTAESVEGLTIRIADENGKALKDLGQGNFVMAAGYYLASYRGINAGQLSDTVYITAYRGGVPVSNTLAYSVESYAYAKQNDGNAELAALVKALMNYGNAARAYAQ